MRLFPKNSTRPGAVRNPKDGPLRRPSDDVALVQRVHGRRLPRWSQVRQVGRVLTARERRWLDLGIAGCIIGFAWFSFSFVMQHRTSIPAHGGRYVEAVVGEPALVNPVFASANDVDMDISRLVFSGLLRYDEQERLVPDLAAKYTISDDKKTYTFELKKDVQWHDGEPFTAHDVAFTFDTIENPAVGSPLLVSFQGVKVEAVDDYTVRFTLPEPFAPFLSALTVGIIPEHLWSGISPDRMRLAQLNLKPIGTGPYMFSTFTKDDVGNIYLYELRKATRYYGVAPYIAEFAFHFFSDYKGDHGAVEALRSQDVDGINYVPYDLRDSVERKHVLLHTLQLPQYTAVFFNLNSSPLLSDKNVRNALTTAIDKTRVIKDGVRNEADPIEGPILSGFPGYKSDRTPTTYDLSAANAALDKLTTRVATEDYLKLRHDALGIQWDDLHPVTTSTPETAVTTTPAAPATTTEREASIAAAMAEEMKSAQTFYRKDKSGNIVSFSLVTADTPEYRQIAQLIAGFWQDVGVKTVVTFVAPKDVPHDVLKDRSYDALLYSVIVGSDPDQYPFWHSSQINSPGLNLSRYVNRSVDQVIEKARATSDPLEADKLYAQIEDTILKDQPAIFLYSPTYTYATTDRVQGIDVDRIFHPSDRFADVATWYVKTTGEWTWKK